MDDAVDPPAPETPGAAPRRRMPLEAQPLASVVAPVPAPPSLFKSIVIGVVVAVAMAGICFVTIAIPFYTLASFEPRGLDRPIVRTGLFKIALPVGVLLGIITGAISGWWLHRGGRWTIDDGTDRYSNR